MMRRPMNRRLSRSTPAIAALLLLTVTPLSWSQQAPLPGLPAQVLPDPNRLPSVNGKPLSKARLDFVMKQQGGAQAGQQGAQQNPQDPQARQAALDLLISREVVAQEAEKKGIARRPDVQMQIEMARQEIIINNFLQDYVRTRPVKEESLKAEYDRARAQRGENEYRARHILVETEAQAVSIIEQLGKGGNFEELAKQSKDAGNKDRGGDLDWNPPSAFVKTFSDAMVKLEKGKFSATPVRTQFGWHVIQLDDMRTASFPAYNEVKPRISQALQEQEVQKLIRELRSKAKVE